MKNAKRILIFALLISLVAVVPVFAADVNYGGDVDITTPGTLNNVYKLGGTGNNAYSINFKTNLNQAECLLLVVQDSGTGTDLPALTSENIVYIDQVTTDGNGNALFNGTTDTGFIPRMYSPENSAAVKNKVFLATSSYAPVYVGELQGVPGVRVSGDVTFYGTTSEKVTLKLKQNNVEKFSVQATNSNTGTAPAACATSYQFDTVPVGDYVLEVSLANHVTREYAITVDSTPVDLDVAIHLKGDVNMDGSVDIGDSQYLYMHLSGEGPITDAYSLKIANVDGQDAVDIGDDQCLYSHLNGDVPLW